tara:strand:- start:1889 stop:3610 length:1722 start_codon:yes stop_codon:yes gene_type:complete
LKSRHQVDEERRCPVYMQGNGVRDMALKKIEEKMMQKGINLAVLDNQELAEVALRFTGDTPPAHLPRETIIQILSDQESIQNWAGSVKDKVGTRAAEAAKSEIRQRVESARSSADTVIQNDPMAAQMAERFGVWLQNSGFTAAQLTQMLDADSDGIITTEEATNLVQTLAKMDPPKWVMNHVANFLDVDGSGQVTVTEWFDFLESIGFEVDRNPAIDEFDDLEMELESDKKEVEKSSTLSLRTYSGPNRIIHVSDGNAKEIQLDGTFLVGGSKMGQGNWVSNTRFTVYIEGWNWWVGELTREGMMTTCVETQDQILSVKPSNLEPFHTPYSGAVAGFYVCDYEPKNDWHYVHIIEDSPGNFTWKNRAGVEWVLTLKAGVLYLSEDCPYYKDGFRLWNIVTENDGRTALVSPSVGEKYYLSDERDYPAPEKIEKTVTQSPAHSPTVEAMPEREDEELGSEINQYTELMIQELENSRLSSEANSIIEGSTVNQCIIKIEEVSRSLLAPSNLRGGCTIHGKIDGGPFTVGIMFSADQNEMIESLKMGTKISCYAKIVKWSSGSRQATLEGQNPMIR